MKAEDPSDKTIKYFVDKCLPFGSSISCALFQEVSDAIRYLLEHKIAYKVPSNRSINNYLDDFLFIARTLTILNWMIQQFLDLCEMVGIPINMKKTEWATQVIVFLGFLLNGKMFTISVPNEKRELAIHLLQLVHDKKSATV